MADLTRLIELLVSAALTGGGNVVAIVDKAVAGQPELQDEWAALRPVFVRLENSGELRTIITGALMATIAAIIAGKGTIGGSHGHHG